MNAFQTNARIEFDICLSTCDLRQILEIGVCIQSLESDKTTSMGNEGTMYLGGTEEL